MKQINPSEIKPGMTIRWETGGITHECEVEAVTPSLASGAVDLDAVGDGLMRIERATLVTVLSEPAPPQPEEPTAFGARVVAGRDRFLRCDCDDRPWRCVSVDGALGFFVDWPLVCEAGPVTVVDADPSWTAPKDTPVDAPVVPERIEEWPEDDTELRKHKWRDSHGCVWADTDDGWRTGNYPLWPDVPLGGPWTRVSDV